MLRRFVSAPCPRAPHVCWPRSRGTAPRRAASYRPLCQGAFAHLRRTTRIAQDRTKIAHDAQQNCLTVFYKSTIGEMVMSNCAAALCCHSPGWALFCVAGDLAPPIGLDHVGATTASIHTLPAKAPFLCFAIHGGKIDNRSQVFWPKRSHF